MILENRSELEFILKYRPDPIDAIVVEGYDGVGKGTILNYLSEYFRVVPYRPDYNKWLNFDIRPQDRWKISGFFWDILSHFKKHLNDSSKVMLFDRGVLSGAVYNNDMSIADLYKDLIKGLNVLHIYVTCSPEDYTKFMKVRNPGITEDEIKTELTKFSEYEQRYFEAFNRLGKYCRYITYQNHYDKYYAQESAKTCAGCGHYSYGYCQHPDTPGIQVDGNSVRCNKSQDKETQDRAVDNE